MMASATATAVSGRKVQKLLLPGQQPDGEYILSVLVKRTYDIVPGQACVRAACDLRIISGDQFWEDPMNSSVKHESDFVPWKVATDVVLNGKAYAPQGKPADTFVTRLEVGETVKEVLAVGDRFAEYTGGLPAFTDPLPVTTIDLRYENAYGGADIYSDRKLPCLYARNPTGKGFVIRNARETIDKLALPNLEDPSDRLTPERLCCGHFMHWERQPMPQCFGWFPKAWQPRAALAGVLPADRATEQELRKMYAQAVPKEQRALYEQTQLPDMNFRFFNGASQGLSVPYLRGDEPVSAVNLSPEGALEFRLPGDRPKLGLDIGEGVQEPEVVLHTVMIRMEQMQVDLVWRGAVPYAGPDWLPQMRKCEISVE
jgi:hypothetical protein